VVTVDVFETDAGNAWLCMGIVATLLSLCLQLLPQQLVIDLVATVLPSENE
jgi:hypothetical protein